MTVSEAPVDGDQNRASGIMALIWIEFSIVLILVTLRIFTRVVIIRHVGLDDISIVVTLISTLI